MPSQPCFAWEARVKASPWDLLDSSTQPMVLYLHFWLGVLTGEFVGFDTVQSQDQGINLKEVEFRTTP